MIWTLPCLSNFTCDEKDKPDIVLGNCYGGTCKKEIFELTKKIFVEKGFKVSLNIPFCGGFITKNYGKPKKNINCIQIEINRKLYMDERRQIKNNDFEKLKNIFYTISLELSEILNLKKLTYFAAE